MQELRDRVLPAEDNLPEVREGVQDGGEEVRRGRRGLLLHEDKGAPRHLQGGGALRSRGREARRGADGRGPHTGDRAGDKDWDEGQGRLQEDVRRRRRGSHILPLQVRARLNELTSTVIYRQQDNTKE